jgi:hypothetical protein
LGPFTSLHGISSSPILADDKIVLLIDFSFPVAAEGKIYVVSLSGKVSVLKAGAELEILAVNDLHEERYASPALGPGEIYIRTKMPFTPSGPRESEPEAKVSWL